jgi:hypothetical protein
MLGRFSDIFALLKVKDKIVGSKEGSERHTRHEKISVVDCILG